MFYAPFTRVTTCTMLLHIVIQALFFSSASGIVSPTFIGATELMRNNELVVDPRDKLFNAERSAPFESMGVF